MKKALITLLFASLMWPLMAQINYMTVQGTIIDINTGAPVVNHAVTIQTDSVYPSGFYYYNTVYTNNTGFYIDTILFNLGYIPSGVLTVYTFDCQQFQHSATFSFSPGNQFFTSNFNICSFTSNCDAEFSYQNLPGGTSVQFVDNSIAGGNAQRFWDFGDGGSSTLLNPIHTYSQPGMYSVSLMISDSAALCWDNEMKFIQVGDSTGTNCFASFFAIPDSSDPMNILFFDQSVGDSITSWFWEFGDGATSSSQNPTHLYTQPGAYVVCLTISSIVNNDTLCYNTGCMNVTVGNGFGCQAAFTWYADTVNNSGTTLHFIDLSTGGGATWFWSFGDSTFSTDPNPTHAFTQPGSYYVCLTISGLNPACQSSWCTWVTVGSNVGCESSFVYSQSGLTVDFTGYMLNAQPASYTWSFGDGSSGTGVNVVHTFAAPGSYSVTLTTDYNNCTFTSTQNVIVGDSINYNFLFGQVFEGNNFLSSGIAMIFSIDSVNSLPYSEITTIDSLGYYYFSNVPQGNFMVWVIPTDASNYLPTYFGDVLFWQDATIISLGLPNNPYNINLIQAANAPVGPGSISGHINNGLKNGLDDKIRMILTNEQGSAIGFANVSSTGDFDFATLQVGVYYLRAELPGLTSDIIRIEITEEKPEVEILLTYSGNHLLAIGEKNAVIESITVFPNPFTEHVKIRFAVKKEMNVTVLLTDLNGRALLTLPIQLVSGINNLSIATGELPLGTYFLQMSDTLGILFTRTLVKSN